MYFERLMDHIQAGSIQREKANLQNIRYLQARPADSFVSYPTSAPFDLATGPSDQGDMQSVPHVAILEGYPSALSTVFLGSRFNIRPEFFIDHLVASRRSDAICGLYEQPTIPSRLDNVVRIPFSRLIECSSSHYSDKDFIRDRIHIIGALDKYDKSIAHDKWYGATRYRRINLHDRRVCSTEQNLSLTIGKLKESWTGMSNSK